jgi:putative transposase
LSHLELEFSAYDPCWEEEENSMKASEFSEAWKAYIVKPDEEGGSVTWICRVAGIPDAACYNWKKKHAGRMSTG